MSFHIYLPELTAYVEERRYEKARQFYFWLGAAAETL